MRQRVRRWRLHQRNDLKLEDIATWVRPVLSGWVRYYGRFYPSKLRSELHTIDEFIVRWASRKYKRFHGRVMASWKWLRALKRRNPCMPGTVDTVNLKHILGQIDTQRLNIHFPTLPRNSLLWLITIRALCGTRSES